MASLLHHLARTTALVIPNRNRTCRAVALSAARLRVSLLSRIGVTATLVVLSACTSSPPSPPRYYQLSAQAPSIQPATNKLDSLGIGPIIWPEYLERRQLLTRVDAHTLKAADSDRWAEPLENNFTRVLRENLTRFGVAQRIVAYPWNAAEPPSRVVRIDVLQFDSDTQGIATLRASWRIEDGRGTSKGADHVGEWQSRAADTSASAMVAAQGACLAKLAEAIDKAIAR